MNDVVENEDELTSKKSLLAGKSVIHPHVIPVELMSGIGKLMKIVNSEDQNLTFTLRDTEIEIRLGRPIFVSEISLTLASFDNVKGMKLVATDLLTNKPEKMSITVEKVSGPSVRFILNKVITSFVLRRESLFSKDIKKIKVSGIFFDELEAFERDHKFLSEMKEELLNLIERKQSEFDERDAAIVTGREKLDAQVRSSREVVEKSEAEQKELAERNDELVKEIAVLDDSLDSKKRQESSLLLRNGDLEKRNIGLDSELAQKNQTLASANVAISNAEEKLKQLVNNVNVFSEEFSGFVDQGRKQVNMYAALAVVPLLLLSIVVFNLFRGAVDLSTKFNEIPKIDLLTLFVTRLPFVAVAALIIGVSVKILLFLVNRIISIHQQRLDLAKIAIIAKDVSDASAVGSKMTPKDLYEAKTYLKMSVLKSYLSDQIERFTYASRQREELNDGDLSPEQMPLGTE